MDHFRNFWTSVTLTLDQVIWHTVMYHALTSTYIPNFVQIGITLCGQMHVQTSRRTLRPTLLRWLGVTPVTCNAKTHVCNNIKPINCQTNIHLFVQKVFGTLQTGEPSSVSVGKVHEIAIYMQEQKTWINKKNNSTKSKAELVVVNEKPTNKQWNNNQSRTTELVTTTLYRQSVPHSQLVWLWMFTDKHQTHKTAYTLI